MDTFCQSPATTNIQRKNANIPNERRITLDILAEMLNGLTLHSTIINSAYYNTDGYDAESDSKSDPLVATHTSDGKKIKSTDTDNTNRNSPQTLLINRTISVIIPPINLPIANAVAADRGTTHAHQTISSKVVVTDAARSGARVFRDPTTINRKDMDGTIPQYRNTSKIPPILTSSLLVDGGTSFLPNRTGSHSH